MALHFRLWAGLLALTLMGLGGCHASALAKPISEERLEGRSLAFESRALQHAQRDVARLAKIEGLPWYATRNDQLRATLAGQRSPVVDMTQSMVYDRQFQSGGRVYDVYSRYTYRLRYQQSIH